MTCVAEDLAALEARIRVLELATVVSIIEDTLTGLKNRAVDTKYAIYDTALWRYDAVSTTSDDINIVESLVGPGVWRRQIPTQMGKGGIIANGHTGVLPRPNGNVLFQNDGVFGNHAIVSGLNLNPLEEVAYEALGRLSNGADQQHGAFYWRFVNGDNGPTTFHNVWGIHVSKYGQDNNSIIGWGNGAVRLAAGSTLGGGDHNNPPSKDHFVDIYTYGKARGYFMVGPDFEWDQGTLSDTDRFRLQVQNGLIAGRVVTAAGPNKGKIDREVRFHWSDANSEAVFEGYNPVDLVWTKVGVYGVEIRVGSAGQKVGFGGAAPILPPVINGSFADLAAVAAVVGEIHNTLKLYGLIGGTIS